MARRKVKIPAFHPPTGTYEQEVWVEVEDPEPAPPKQPEPKAENKGSPQVTVKGT